MNVGFGMVRPVGQHVTRDLYAKVYYSHQNSSDSTLDGVGNGETYHFDAVDSLRTRLEVYVSTKMLIKT